MSSKSLWLALHIRVAITLNSDLSQQLNVMDKRFLVSLRDTKNVWELPKQVERLQAIEEKLKQPDKGDT